MKNKAVSQKPAQTRPTRSGFNSSPITLAAMYLFFLAVIARTLAWFASAPAAQDQLPWVTGMEWLCLLLFSLQFWRPAAAPLRKHLYFAFQAGLVVTIMALAPDLDFVAILFILLSYQVALAFNGHIRQAWVGLYVLLCIVPLIFFRDALHTLALELSAMAASIVFASFVAANQEDESIRAHHQATLAELQETHRQLQAYAGQVEELAAIEERNRLARELHDSVSQTLFSIMLNIRTAQLLMERDPARLPAQLDTLQNLAQSALAEMRGLIAQLRPKTP
jgi:signal transduction histidine kinase